MFDIGVNATFKYISVISWKSVLWGGNLQKTFVRCTISKKWIDPFLICTFSTSSGFNHRVLLNFRISDDAIYQIL